MKQFKIKQKKKKGGFLGIVLGTISATLLWNLSTDQGKNRAGEGTTRAGESTVRAGQNF